MICFEIKFFSESKVFNNKCPLLCMCVYMVSKELKRITESLRIRRMRIEIFLFCFLARFWYVILEKINYYSPLTRIIILERISILDIVFLLKYHSKMIVIFFCFDHWIVAMSIINVFGVLSQHMKFAKWAIFFCFCFLDR